MLAGRGKTLGALKASLMNSAEHIHSNPQIVIIGGGGGCATLFPEFAAHTENATAVVSMSDDGGSTGRLSRELNVPAVGDLRNVMMAASRNAAVRDMRYNRLDGDGGLHGHSMGNIALAACIQTYGFEQGLQVAHQMWDVPGEVLPVTLEPHHLVMEDGSATVVTENEIDEYKTTSREPWLRHDPVPGLNRLVGERIRSADAIVFAAGSVYTSQLAALLVGEMREELAATSAPKILVANVVAEPHQTRDWHVADYVNTLRRHGVPLDVVLYNNVALDPSILEQYAHDGECLVDFAPERFKEIGSVQAIGADIISRVGLTFSPHDVVKRGRIRHDAAAVRRHIWGLLAARPRATV